MFESHFLATPEDRFCRVEAQMIQKRSVKCRFFFTINGFEKLFQEYQSLTGKQIPIKPEVLSNLV